MKKGNFQGRLFCLLGKSCTGKDTLYKMLMADPECALKSYVTYTTRPMRLGEVDGEDYFFVPVQKLEDFKVQGRLIEERIYNTVHGPWHYATVDDHQLEDACGDYLSIVTLEAFNRLKAYFGDQAIIPLYIDVPDAILLRRAMERTEKDHQPNYHELCRRFLADAKDFSEEALIQAGIGPEFIFKNVDLQDTFMHLKAAIIATRSKL